MPTSAIVAAEPAAGQGEAGNTRGARPAFVGLEAPQVGGQLVGQGSAPAARRPSRSAAMVIRSAGSTRQQLGAVPRPTTGHGARRSPPALLEQQLEQPRRALGTPVQFADRALFICSGDMAGVPTVKPTKQGGEAGRRRRGVGGQARRRHDDRRRSRAGVFGRGLGRRQSLARPQSITTVSLKGPSRMLSGLRSRWMIRWLWA